MYLFLRIASYKPYKLCFAIRRHLKNCIDRNRKWEKNLNAEIDIRFVKCYSRSKSDEKEQNE